MRIAYADPPYMGQSARKYRKRPDYAGEVNHAALVASLADYDGWALSASSPSLHVLLPLCPSGTRVAAWVKPYAWLHPQIRVAYAWEPLLFRPARDRREPGRRESVHDWVQVSPQMNSKLPGQKPYEFCLWLFNLLGLDRDDEFVDLFPGSGAVAEAWTRWSSQLTFATQSPEAVQAGGDQT